MADETPILAVVAANGRVDPARLREMAAASRVRLATAEEVARIHPESDPGAVPPLGPLYGQRVFVDQAVMQHVGAVNEKIEASSTCARPEGLSGHEGVLIPAANKRHLMLRRDVVEAVAAGSVSHPCHRYD
jgi:hypothetical protein